MPLSVRQTCLCKPKKMLKRPRKLEKNFKYKQKKRVVKKIDKLGKLTKLNWQLSNH